MSRLVYAPVVAWGRWAQGWDTNGVPIAAAQGGRLMATLLVASTGGHLAQLHHLAARLVPA